MEHEEKHRPRRQMFWGVLLMALGGLFLLDRTGIIDMPEIWKFWPVVLLAAGAFRFWDRRPGSGTMLILMALAFFTAEFGWMGLSWATFWPLLLVAVGAGIVIRAFSHEDERCKDQEASRD